MDEWSVGSENKSLSGKVLSCAVYTDISYRREKRFLGFTFDTGKPGGSRQQKENPASGVMLCMQHTLHPESLLLLVFRSLYILEETVCFH